MPINLALTDVSGKVTNIHIPVEVWMRSNSIVYKANTTTKIDKITIDPKALYPDIDLRNNVWKLK